MHDNDYCKSLHAIEIEHHVALQTQATCDITPMVALRTESRSSIIQELFELYEAILVRVLG
jgi:hypothetical protein